MKKFVTWEEVEGFVKHIESTVQALNMKPTGVYGLPRGGLVMAVMVSNKMGIPMLMSPAPGCLVVDDICDTGESLLHYVKNSSGNGTPNYLIATLYYKENKLGIKPDIYKYIKGEDWIVFPWEMEVE